MLSAHLTQPSRRSLHGHDYRIHNYTQLKFTDLGRRLMLAGARGFISRSILRAAAGPRSRERAEGRGSEGSLCHRRREADLVS